MSNFPPVTSLTTGELLRYAQMKLDFKASLPLDWQQELVNRLAHPKETADVPAAQMKLDLR